MLTEQYVNYIRTETARGVSHEAIHQALVLNGLTEADILEGFAQAGGTSGAPLSPSVLGAVPVAPSVSVSAELGSWEKDIVMINRESLKLSGITLGVDTLILAFSGFSLWPFYLEMMVVFGVFLLFMYYENDVLAKRFASSPSSPIDKDISTLVRSRNLVFYLNFIPVLQIFGFYALIAPLISLIPYTLHLRKRFKETPLAT